MRNLWYTSKVKIREESIKSMKSYTQKEVYSKCVHISTRGKRRRRGGGFKMGNMICRYYPLDGVHLVAVRAFIHLEVLSIVRQRGELNRASQLKSSEQQISSTITSRPELTLIRQDQKGLLQSKHPSRGSDSATTYWQSTQ